MVLFENINVNQRVEVKWQGQICTGTVKYKGCINGVPGDWVGVALDTPVGKHDGMINGRRYFSCINRHGIFTQANKLRFIRMKRCLYNRYRTKQPEEPEEDMFTPHIRPEVDEREVRISYEYHRRAADNFPARVSLLDPPKPHRLSHPVSNSLKAVTMRPESGKLSLSSRSLPLYYDYYDEEPFISPPSIPRTHMPHTALKKQVRRGWDNTHYVREMSVNTGRDSIKFSQWNDISE